MSGVLPDAEDTGGTAAAEPDRPDHPARPVSDLRARAIETVVLVASVAVAVPVVIAASLASMILLSGSIVGIAIVVTVWGALFSSWLIVVNAWAGHRMPDRLEAGGSLVVVGFQGAITLAAGVGGLLVDAVGVELVYTLGAAALVLGAVLFGASNRAGRTVTA